jgi:hypothetical protein
MDIHESNIPEAIIVEKENNNYSFGLNLPTIAASLLTIFACFLLLKTLANKSSAGLDMENPNHQIFSKLDINEKLTKCIEIFDRSDLPRLEFTPSSQLSDLLTEFNYSYGDLVSIKENLIVNSELIVKHKNANLLLNLIYSESLTFFQI